MIAGLVLIRLLPRLTRIYQPVLWEVPGDQSAIARAEVSVEICRIFYSLVDLHDNRMQVAGVTDLKEGLPAPINVYA